MANQVPVGSLPFATFVNDTTAVQVPAGAALVAMTAPIVSSISGVGGTSGVGSLTTQIFNTPTLDGHATGTATAATTVSASLTTIQTNDIVCALVHVENATGTGAMWVTGVAGGSLTWQKRRGISNGSNNCTLELWWAVATGTLSTTSITATFNQTCDDASILVFGVNGCNLSQPWDNNISLPAQHQFFATAAPSIASISTTQANDFIIFGVGSTDNWTSVGTVPTGFTQIGFASNSGGTNASSVGAAYKGVTTAQSNQTYAWGSTIPAAQYQCAVALVDALTAESGTLITVPQLEYVNGTEATGTNSAVAYAASPSSGDMLVLVSYCEVASGTAPTISSITGGALSWTQRTRSHGSAFGSMEVWYCKLSATLALTTLTVNYSGSFDTTSLICFAVNGSAIFDANAALPAHSSNTVPSNPWTASVSVTTTSTSDFIFALPGVRAASTNTTGPTGFQWITNQNATGGTHECDIAFAINTVGSPQSAVTVAWGTTLADSSGGEYIVDALTMNPPVTPSITGVAATGYTARIDGQNTPYTSLNPADLTTATLSSGFLKFTAASTNSGVRAVDPIKGGKYYFEITWGSTLAGADSGIGLSKATASFSGLISNATGGVITYRGFGIFVNGTNSGVNPGACAANGTTGVAVDLTNSLIWFTQDGTHWNSTSVTNNPSGGSGGVSISGITSNLLFPTVLGNSSGDNGTLNFGASAFTYTVPSGFTAGWPAGVQLSGAYAGMHKLERNAFNYEDEQLQDGWQDPRLRLTRSRTTWTFGGVKQVEVSKFLTYDVITTPDAASVSKFVAYDVLSAPDALSISKIVQYVVLDGSALPQLPPFTNISRQTAEWDRFDGDDHAATMQWRTARLKGVGIAPAGGIFGAVSGVAATGAAGSPAIEIDDSFAGAAGTGTAGVLTIPSSLNGAQGTGQATSPSLEIDVPVVGVETDTGIGTLLVRTTTPVVGVTASGQHGLVASELDGALTGVAALGQPGTPTTVSSGAVSVIGVAASGQSGITIVQTDRTTTVIGVMASGFVGIGTAGVSISIIGITATTSLGAIASPHTSLPNGAVGTGQVGVFGISKSTDAAIVGVTGTAHPGNLNTAVLSGQSVMMVCL